MIYIAAFWLTCAGILLWLAANAPEGWQDSRGFHLGREPFDQFGRERTNALTSARSLSLHSSVTSRKGQ